MKDLGGAKMSLGLQIVMDRTKRVLLVSQQKNATRVLPRFGFDQSHPVLTPVEDVRDPAQLLEDLDNRNVCDNSVPNRRAIGCLIYLVIGTCPDNAFALEMLSRFCERPLEKHWIAA